MSFSRMKSLWRNLLHKQQVDDDLNAEMRAYVDQVTAEKIESGASPAEARRQALVEFGGVEQVKEEVRGIRAGALLEQFWQDVHFGLRTLRKNPGFALVAVLTIALGIGVNASIFTLFDSIALRPLPLPESNRIISVYETVRGHVSRSVYGGLNLFSYPEYLAYRDQNHVFSELAGYMPEIRGTMAESRDEISGQLATCNYFDVLRVKPVLGRGFSQSECAVDGQGPVVVLSDELWRNSFHADPQILGRTIRFNRVPLTVIGVMPPEFRGNEIIPALFWSPMTMASQLVREGSQQPLTNERASWVGIMGRLKDGVSLPQARADLAVIAARIDQRTPGRTTTLSIDTATLFAAPEIRKVVYSVGGIVMVAVGLVLLIACANIANLMLARSTARSREIAVRLAIGASRARLVRQLLTESAVVAAIGGISGLLVSVWSQPALVKAIVSKMPSGGPFFPASTLPDPWVLGYALALVALTALASGLAPALQATRVDLNRELKQESGAMRLVTSRGRLRNVMLGGQIAVCMVLLISAGLLLRGLYHAQNVDPGFDMRSIGAITYNLQRDGYTAQQATAFNRDLAERMASLGGVEAVTPVASAPLSDMHFQAHFHLAGETDGRLIEFNYVGARFFTLMGIPLLRGRQFTDAEISSDAQLAIVSESTARQLWPGQDPIGKKLLGGVEAKAQHEVIGVARDVQVATLGDAQRTYIYFPAGPKEQLEVRAVLVRTAGPFSSAIATMRNAAHALDPDMKVDAAPLADNIDQWLIPAQICAALASALGALGLMLSIIGIYGTVSYAVGRRVREIGIRMALGARGGDVKALILRQSMKPLLIGAIVGVGLCAGVSRILAQSDRLLFGISPLDGIAFTAVPAFLAIVALLASYLPARRAVRVDPMVALRHE